MTVMREGRAPSAGARLVRPPAARVLGESLQVVLRSSEMERGVTARANHLGPWRLVSDVGVLGTAMVVTQDPYTQDASVGAGWT
jgi:hypothetical protein